MEQEAKRMGESSPTGQTKSISQKEEMQMFNRKFKLIGTAIGLVAVLMMLVAMPGVTQQNPLSRQNIVAAINNAVAALTASEGDILDTEEAKFYSDARVAFTYIPLHPASRSLKLLEERLEDLFAGRAVNVDISALYLPGDAPGFLKAGVYKMKLVDKTKVALVDQEGREVFSGKVNTKDTRGQPGPFIPWQITVASPNEKVTIILHFFCSVTITIIIEW